MSAERVVPTALLEQIETVLLRVARIVHTAGYVEEYGNLKDLAIKVQLVLHNDGSEG